MITVEEKTIKKMKELNKSAKFYWIWTNISVGGIRVDFIEKASANTVKKLYKLNSDEKNIDDFINEIEATFKKLEEK